MLLLTAGLLLQQIEAGEENIKHMTGYGILIGHCYPLKVLKLSVNFEEGSQMFQEYYSIPPNPASWVYIDMVIQYVMEHLT